MSRASAFIAALVFVTALHFADRIAAGVLQCESAETCPVTREKGFGSE